MKPKWSRRDFLKKNAELTSLLLGSLALASVSSLSHGAARRLSSVSADPFTLGVASGDPTPDSIVLWTRLAREVMMESGAVDQAVQVDYELSESSSFNRVIRSGSIAASPELGHSVHADVRGLDSDQVYFYRWQVGNVTSPIGRTKTAPAASARNENFRLAFASCQQYEHGYFTAYKHMADEEFDLIIHLGDYIYERSWGNNLVRNHEGPEIITLQDYRNRYNTYKSDPDIRAAHASAPWVVTWDDHEVDNNYAGEIAEDEQTPEQFLRRRVDAYQAYYEFMPIRLPVGREGPDMPIHRRLRFGNLMEMHVLDTRQYRNDQACGDGRKISCDEHQDPTRSALGQAQKNWLLDGLATTEATWNVLAQQIMMASLRGVSGAGERLWPMDIWDGYPYERQQLLEHLDTVSTPNPVVLTGDIHSNWAADLKLDFDIPSSKVVGSEYIGTSISSGGDGQDMTNYGSDLLANNPHVKFYNANRGYVSATLTPSLWKADYKTVPYITSRGAPINIRKTYVTEAGRPGVQEN